MNVTCSSQTKSLVLHTIICFIPRDHYLVQLLSRAEVKEEHMNSSNLLHLEAILHICEHAPAVTAVQQGFCYLPRGTGSLSQSVLVDVVAHEGGTWVRVFARNRKAIHQKWLGKRLHSTLFS